MSQEQYYLGIAKQVSERGTCFRRKIGAIIVRGDQIISTGYVGAPRKTKDCFEHGFCLRNKLNIPPGQRYELCRSVHAEQNAIINAARAGVSVLGGTIYIWACNPDGSIVRAFPCFICKKMIINAGLEWVICSIEDNKVRRFTVEQFKSEWRQNDIVDDKDQYGVSTKPDPAQAGSFFIA